MVDSTQSQNYIKGILKHSEGKLYQPLDLLLTFWNSFYFYSPILDIKYTYVLLRHENNHGQEKY